MPIITQLERGDDHHATGKMKEAVREKGTQSSQSSSREKSPRKVHHERKVLAKFIKREKFITLTT